MTKTMMTLAVEDTVTYDIAAIPLNSEQAEALMDRDGNITVTLLLDQEKYFDHVIASASSGAITPETYAHDVAFSFGTPVNVQHESAASPAPNSSFPTPPTSGNTWTTKWTLPGR